MPRSNDEKTREFQKKMRTQGAAGFAAGPWKEVEESLGMDQSVVVDQDGNPVWSVQHTRKPRHTVSRSTFDKLLGGVAVLAIATLLTSVLAIYYEQTHDTRISSLFAGSEPASDPDAGNTITLLRPPTSGLIDRPAVEVVEVEHATSDRDIMTGTLETETPAATRDALQESPEAGTRPLAYAGPDAAVETPGPVTESAAATDQPDDSPAGVAAMAGPAVSLPGPHAPDSSVDAETHAAPTEALATLGPDTAEAIETITRRESPAAIATSTASTGMADEAPSMTMPASAPAMAGQADAAESLAAIEPAAGPEVTRRAAVPVIAEVPGDAPAMTDTGAAGVAAAMEIPARPEPASPVPVTAEMAAAIPGSNPVPQSGAVSPAETPDSDTPKLALLEPARSAPSPASEAASELGATAAVTMDDVPLPGATGRWIINLASYAGPKTADRMQRKFEDLGVITDRQVAEVNGKTMYRLRIASFESRQDAQAYFDSIKDTLGLKSAWITKK